MRKEIKSAVVGLYDDGTIAVATGDRELELIVIVTEDLKEVFDLIRREFLENNE